MSPHDTDDLCTENALTLADRFILAFYEPECASRAGVIDVEEVFGYLTTITKELIEFKLISMDMWCDDNGVALWEKKKLELPTTPTKENILAFLKSNIDKESMGKSPDDTDDPRIEKFWTVADLFIRQYLNNACDGFGMENVEGIFEYLVTVKKELVDFKHGSEGTMADVALAAGATERDRLRRRRGSACSSGCAAPRAAPQNCDSSLPCAAGPSARPARAISPSCRQGRSH